MEVDVEKIVREYIPDVIHLSLGTSRDNNPWVCEVHFAYDEDLNLYFRSLASRRHSEEIASNPMVAGNIIKQHSVNEAAVGVYFEGIAEMLTGDDEILSAAKITNDRLGGGKGIIEEAKRDNGHRFYKIAVRTWYVFGKLDGVSGRKYELTWR